MLANRLRWQPARTVATEEEEGDMPRVVDRFAALRDDPEGDYSRLRHQDRPR